MDATWLIVWIWVLVAVFCLVMTIVYTVKGMSFRKQRHELEKEARQTSGEASTFVGRHARREPKRE